MFNVQNSGYFTFPHLSKSIIAATGGHINPAYFQMLDMEISECLYHLFIYVDHTESNRPSKVDEWGINNSDFE
ncbi:hypothetical protein AWQ22_14070 [Picosynechococcus sp. PCC 7117]|nr:hypothetical protein AWQ22_14070 [Picosynechococcus sp. PCC 7117]